MSNLLGNLLAAGLMVFAPGTGNDFHVPDQYTGKLSPDKEAISAIRYAKVRSVADMRPIINRLHAGQRRIFVSCVKRLDPQIMEAVFVQTRGGMWGKHLRSYTLGMFNGAATMCLAETGVQAQALMPPVDTGDNSTDEDIDGDN